MNKITVMSLFRDAGDNIHEVLKRFDSLSKVADVEYYFYENDSKDNTRAILSGWLESRKGKLFYEDLNVPKFGSVPDISRLLLLGYYRNKLLTKSLPLDSEYTLMIDSDIVFDSSHLQILLDNIEKSAMITANTRCHQIPDFMTGNTTHCYYDVFALRDKYFNDGFYFTDCPLGLYDDRELWTLGGNVEVSAAFGGFALMKSNILNDCRWSTTSHSEHINFCSDVRRHGPIKICVKCQPSSIVDMSTVNISACQQIAQSQIQKIENMNNLYRYGKNK